MPEVNPSSSQPWMAGAGAEPNVPAAQPEEAVAPAVSGGPSTPAEAPAVGAAPASPVMPGTPPVTATSSNPGLHGFVSRVLGALAGSPTPSYQVDKSGRMVATPAPPMSIAQKVARIGDEALIGLSAGANAPKQKSGLASALAGAGAGAAAEKGAEIAKDQRGRQQANEDFERDQKATMQKMELGRTAALTYRNWQEGRKLDLDMDPQRKAGLDVYDAAVKANIPGAQIMTDQEWMQRAEADPNFSTTHVHMPAGFAAPTTGEDGTVTPGAGQVVVLPATEGGQIALPQSVIDQADKYGSLSGRFSGSDVKKLKAGMSVPVEQFGSLMHAVEEGRNTWLKGELTPELNWDGDKPVLSNSVTHEKLQSMPAGITTEKAKEEQKAERAEAAKSGLEAAQTEEAKAKAKEALANAALANQTFQNTPKDPAAMDNLLKAYSGLPQNAKNYLQNLNPASQATVLSLWSGRIDPKSLPTTIRKGTGQLSRQQYESIVSQMDPTWVESKYEQVRKLDEEYNDPKKAGGSISSFGQFLQHAALAKNMSDNYQRTNSRFLDTPLNELRTQFKDDASVTNLGIAVTAGRNEWENIIKSGHAPTKDEVNAAKILADENSTVRQIAGAFNTMGHQGVSRLGELDQRYKTVTGTGYPNILSPKARKAAEDLGLQSEIGDFNTGGSLFTGGTVHQQLSSPSGQTAPTLPAGATHVVPGPDGKNHYTNADGTKDFGVAP